MTEQVLSLLGLAKKAGRVEVGEEPVGAAAPAQKARVILVAQDAGPSSQRRAFSFAQTGACLCLTLPADKDALGRSLGRSSVAMCAVTDIGFAGAIAKKLAAMDGGKYGAAAAQLDVKAQRAMERRAEQARHEKNLRQGPYPQRQAAGDGASAGGKGRQAAQKRRKTALPQKRQSPEKADAASGGALCRFSAGEAGQGQQPEKVRPTVSRNIHGVISAPFTKMEVALFG